MLRYAAIVTLAIAAPVLTPCLAADPATKQATVPVAPTATFVAQVAFGNMFEVESSKLALERSKGAPVTAFAQRMVDDHSAAAVNQGGGAGSQARHAAGQARRQTPGDRGRARRQAGRQLRQGLNRGAVQGARQDRRAVQGLRPGRRGIRGRAATQATSASRPRRQDALILTAGRQRPVIATAAARSRAPGCCRRSGCC
jgi:hypothetical protein